MNSLAFISILMSILIGLGVTNEAIVGQPRRLPWQTERLPYSSFMIEIAGNLERVQSQIGASSLFVYGLISIGVPSDTAFQISSISWFVTAIQPSVQSLNRWAAPIAP